MSAFIPPTVTPPAEVPSRCAFVLHGLNTNPDRMNDIADLLRQKKITTIVGRLTGHQRTAPETEKITAEIWKADFTKQWNEAMANCQNKNDDRIFVGYSLGALLALHHTDTKKESIKPTELILISPALTFRWKVLSIRALSWLPFGSLPSVNNPDYRAQDKTPLSAYRALFDLNREWKQSAWINSFRIRTLVALTRDDELVDSQSLESLAKEKAPGTWQVLWLSNEDSKLEPKYHHLIIDKLSMGNTAWEHFANAVDRFLKKPAAEDPRHAN